MSDKFSLKNFSLKTLSTSQLSEVVYNLKVNGLRTTMKAEEIIETFRFLHAFVVSQKETIDHILETGIIPLLNNFLRSEDENVQVDAVALLTVIALKSSKSSQSTISDTSVMILSDLLEAVDYKTSFQVLEALGQQIQFISSTRPFVASVNLIMKLVELLKSKDMTDAGRINILHVAMNVVNAGIDVVNKTSENEDGEEGDEEKSSSSSSSSSAFSSSSFSSTSSSSSSSFSTSCNSASDTFSSSSSSSASISYKGALAMLTIAISRLVKSNNASLRGMCIGYLDAVRCCYGQNFADEGVAEGEKFDIQFDPDTTSVSISGGTCTFKTNGSHRTVFLSQVFKDKIYRIEIKIHSWGSNDSLYFGFCPETKKQKAISNYITYSSGAGSGGSVAMFFSSSTLNTYCTGNGECGSNMWSTNPITSNSTVALELNMKAHTLHFFVNGKQLSNYFQHIPSMPLSFGITGNYSPKVQVMSVMNLSAPLAKSGGTAYLWM